jgi:hypothetical protein
MYRPTKYFKTVKVFYILYWGFSAILTANSNKQKLERNFIAFYRTFAFSSRRYVGNDRNVYCNMFILVYDTSLQN